MSKIWFTSDLHFGHENVIKYCDRPYHDADKMNLDIIMRWNKQVDEDDTVYVLGDFSLSKNTALNIVKQLNGKIVLICGNHDHPHPSNRGKKEEKKQALVKEYVDAGFAAVYTDNVELPGLVLCHLPYASTSGGDRPYLYKYAAEDRGIKLLCGHVHEKWRTKLSDKGTLCINVGWDAWDRLVSLDELNKIERHIKWDFSLSYLKMKKKLLRFLKRI